MKRRFGMSLGSLAGVATIAALAAPHPALAASGTTKLALDGPAAHALRAQGVRIAPLAPASGGQRRVSLPVSAGLAGATSLLRQRGGLSFAAPSGKRARITGIRVLLGDRPRVTARLGRAEVDLFRILRGGRRNVDAAGGAIELDGLRLKLTRSAAEALSVQLGLPASRKSRFGTLSARATGLSSGRGGSPQGTVPLRTDCPQPSGAGPTPESPLPIATRPAGALDITSAAIDWHVRESFIRYVATGEGTSVSGGATADPPQLLPGSSVPLSYDFHFPFAGGWVSPGADLASPADDTAAVNFSGAVRFRYSGHGIDLTTASPEIEINGARSRAIFAISDSGGAAERQLLLNLDLSQAAAIRASGGSYVYERVPGAIPPGTASSVFAGFYTPGTEFGCFTVSFQAGP